jgi:Zn-dependent M28 family amino/carboxypeptidase
MIATVACLQVAAPAENGGAGVANPGSSGSSRRVTMRATGKPVAATAAMGRVDPVVRKLADPKWEGRGPGTAGIDSAAAYLAATMKEMGLAPGGDEGSYFQEMEVTTGVEVGEPCAVKVGDTVFPVGEGMQPVGFSTNGTLKAPLVFAGYGITAPGFEYDDYAGLDVRDKLVLVMTNEPGEMDSTSRFDGSVNTPHAELRTKAINAREHGALGLLVVDGPKYHAGEPLRKPKSDGGGYMTSGLLAAQISADAAAALVAPAHVTLAALQDSIDSRARPHSLALPESATVTVTLRRTKATIKNVVGWIPGRDTTRTLVIGAHYDHLGYGGESSLSPNEHVPHVGADDNASGVAAMLQVAGRAAAARHRSPPLHNLVFCAFTGEEIGLVGSAHFADQPTRPLESVDAMLNMDMVGRLRDNRLMVMGVGTAAEFPELVQRVNQATEKFDLKLSSDGFGPSDHSSFYKKKVPVLMLFTGSHPDYHKPTDTWDKINYTGLARVARFASATIESLDARPRPSYLVAKADSSTGRIAGGGGYGAYLGTIPDYMKTEGGVLLSGVRSGSPAEQAGIKGGDVIVKFDGVRIDNIYDYTFALRSRKPGQQVRITVQREGKEVDLLATLGRRS